MISFSGTISEKEYLLFRDYIQTNSGIIITPEKAYVIETRLSGVIAQTGLNSFSDFYEMLRTCNDPKMKQKVINAITNNETMWFRDKTPWKLLVDIVLPKLIEDLQTKKKNKIRIWSAAASTGPEIYSTVMCIDNYLSQKRITGVSLSDFDFLATDISSEALETAKKGRYNTISIKRGLSDYYREKYFINKGPAWEIEPRIREVVDFVQFNHQDSYIKFGKFDIVFLRYILLYFNDDLRRDIVFKMYRTLADDGVLFTGTYVLYELFGDLFEMNRYENMTYFTKKMRDLI